MRAILVVLAVALAGCVGTSGATRQTRSSPPSTGPAHAVPALSPASRPPLPASVPDIAPPPELPPIKPAHSVSVTTPIRSGINPRDRALLRLEESLQGRIGDLPGHCATLAGERVCVPRVTVDGRPLPDLSVLVGVVQMADNFVGPRPSLRSRPFLHGGVAEAVFERLVELEARRAGIRVSEARARAFAGQELALYVRAKYPRSEPRLSIPGGMTIRQYFLSQRAINAYRDGLMVGEERDNILRRFRLVPPAEVFRAWFRVFVPHYVVTVNGSPPRFSLPDALPENHCC